MRIKLILKRLFMIFYKKNKNIYNKNKNKKYFIEFIDEVGSKDSSNTR